MADRVADYSYPDDKKETVDIINLLLLGWILLGLVVYILGNVIATQIRKRKSKKSAEKGAPSPCETPCSTDESHATSCEFHQSTSSRTPSSCVGGEKEAHDGGSVAHDSILPLKDSAVIPVCTGDDSDVVEWINRVFLWIYKNRILSPILEPWLASLNAKTRLLSTEHGILVDFQNVLQSNQPPVFSEVLESKGLHNKVHGVCETEIQNLSFDILVTQVKERDKNVYKFILNLERLAGQLSMECVPEELLFHLFFTEGTQVQLNVEPSPSTKIPDEEYEMLHGLVCDIASKAFSSSSMDLNFSSFPECPRYRRIELSISNALAESLEKEKEEKLLVKIVKANNLGGQKGCSKPYCVVEMDDPPQKFQTQPAEAESNPLWDESHIFIVKDVCAELLFEVYDEDRKSNENFLGLGIVSIEELMRNPSQRQVIPLQSRPMEKDDVTGSLTAEFLFLGWDLPSPDSCMLGQSQMIMEEGSGKIIETNSRVTARGTIITTTTIKQMKEGNSFKESMVKPKASPEQIHKELVRVISNSRQKFMNDLIHKEPIKNGHIPEPGRISNNSCHQISSNHMAENSKEKFENEMNHLNTLHDCMKTSDDMREGKNSRNDSIMTTDKKITKAADSIEESITNCVVDAHSNVIKMGNGVKNLNVNNNIVPNGNVALHADYKFSGCNDLHDTEKITKNTDFTVVSKDVFDDEDDEGESTDHENSSPALPRILEETVDLSSSTNTLVANTTGNEPTDLTATALRELEKQDASSSPSVSTLIIHSVQKVKKDESGMWQEVAEPDSSGTDSLEASPASYPSADSHSSPHLSMPPSPSVQRNGDVDRSRPKEKKSLISNLRKKLSFRKQRSKSVEQQRAGSSPVPLKANNRSVSTERVKGSNTGRPLLAVPGSTRSSFSEASGLSTASSRTYINENSKLVVELNENGIIKRYFVPTCMIHRTKFIKRGIKLHLYNDHVFVAKHLSGNTMCQVCNKNLTRRPGKQGYECRDCRIQCHKSCHVKVAEFCPNSSVSSMEVMDIDYPLYKGKPQSI